MVRFLMRSLMIGNCPILKNLGLENKYYIMKL